METKRQWNDGWAAETWRLTITNLNNNFNCPMSSHRNKKTLGKAAAKNRLEWLEKLILSYADSPFNKEEYSQT